MKRNKTMLDIVAKGIKYVAEHVEEKNSYTAIGFYKPQKAKKSQDYRQE